ncbi:MAG TPA: ABC transporter permease [Vicinamibacterales bacterium]|nr:ABC transporter permease [Vicinamibacterales bacterium]
MKEFIFRVAIWACPAAIRLEYASEMEEVFFHCVRTESARRRGVSRLLIWPRGIWDLLMFAASVRREWQEPARAQSGGRSGLSRMYRSMKMRPQDVRAVARLARKQPFFSSAVVLMLALGLGASTAIFSVVYGVLLKPLPFPEPDRIVQVWGSLPARQLANLSLTAANFWDMRDWNRAFEELGALHGASFTLTGEGMSPERVSGARVSVGFFRALAVQPVAGRLFAAGEDDPGALAERVILANSLWRQRFGGDPGIVGRTILLDNTPYAVVGVLPAGTPWLDTADVFVPFIRRADADRDSWEYVGIGRIKPGITYDAAFADLERVARELEARYPANKGMGATMAPSSTWVASDQLRQTLWILLGAVGLLLLIACVNVTNLLLARAAARHRESAVRTALGATRADLARERLTESMMFSIAGAVLGLLLALGILQFLTTVGPVGIPRLSEVTLNGWVFAFAVGVTLLVGVLTGVAPALHAPVAHVMTAMRQGQRGSVGDRRQDRTRSLFVGAEVAIALTLLVGAGLLVRSLAQVLTVDRGFQTERRLLLTISIPSAYGEERMASTVRNILTRLDTLPELVSSAAVSGRPLSRGSTGLGLAAADRPDMPDSAVPWASWRIVTKDYFKTMGLSLLAGRGFTEQDLIGKPWRTIISKRAADVLWPGQNPIGRTAILWKGQNESKGEVIGVVADMRERGLESDPTIAVYFPAYGAMATTTLQLVMQTKGQPEDAVPAVRTAVSSIDPGLPISSIRTLDDVVTTSVATRRFTMTLLVTFAGLALFLALAGVYGVLSYSIARRTQEIGVRLALGAEHGRVLRSTILRGLRPVLVGIAIGLGLSFWLSGFMTSLLFGVTASDAGTYVAVTLALVVTAVLSCYIPARQVLRVDPVIALRAE